MIVLELTNVCKNYASPQDAKELCVLQGIDLSVEKGESIAVVGPSGSGKSTLLNVIGALDRATLGQVLVDGRDIGQLDDAGLAEMRRTEIGFVFQLHHLLPQCTVLENVLVPTLPRRRGSGKEVEERARGLLERLGLEQWQQHRPGELSAGQRQRVALGRALINQPKLLLADEPTGALDKAAADNIAQLLIELNRTERTTLIVVTHAAALAQCMGRVFELSETRLTERLEQ